MQFRTAALDGCERYDRRGMAGAHGERGRVDAAFNQIVAHLAATLSALGVDEGTIGEIAGGLAPLRDDIAAAAPDGS